MGYDEKPLKISQKLKEAKQNPVFVLKHVKDNKVFNPAQHASNSSDNNKMEGSSSRSNHLLNAFTSPRPAPKPTPPITYDDDHHSGRSTSQNGNGWKNTSEKRTLEHPKTAITSGRVGYEVVVPVMSSSISTPTPSTSSVGVSGNDNTPPSSTTLTPSSAKRAGTISRKPSENLLSELGLESGMANVIYTIMMDQNQNGN